MNKNLAFIAILALVLLNACRPDHSEEPDGVWIRFRNETDENIKDAVMLFYTNNTIRIGNVDAGKTSGYIYFNAISVFHGKSSPASGDLDSYLSAEVNGLQTFYYGQLIYDTTGTKTALPDGEYTLRVRKKTGQGSIDRWMEFE